MKRRKNLKKYISKILGLILCFLFVLCWHEIKAADLLEETKNEPSLYDDHGKRDPFWPLVTSGGGIMSYETDFLMSDLNLEGVVVGQGQENLAMINGRIVKENDAIGQFVVLRIEADKVTLLKDGQEFELRLK